MRGSRAVIGATGVAAVALVLWSLPATIRLFAHPPAALWLLVGLAFLVDLPLLGLAQGSGIRLRATMSTGLSFAICLRSGLGPAIVVQALAALVSTQLQGVSRLGPVARYVRRHVLALAAAGWAVSRLEPPLDQGATGRALLTFLLLPVAWGVANLAILIVNRALLSGWQIDDALRFQLTDLSVNVVSTLFVLPLLTLVDHWWSPVIVLPLLAVNLISRAQWRAATLVRRDATTGLLTRVGLAQAIDELTLYDGSRAPHVPPFAVILLSSTLIPEIHRGLGRDFYEKLVRVSARQTAAGLGSTGLGALPVGRIPGEGVVIIAAGVDADQALALAGTAVRANDGPFEVDDIPFVPKSVAGVALSPEHGRDLDTLLRHANRAVVQGRHGGDRVHLYVPGATAPLDRRAALLSELAAVLRDPDREAEIEVLFAPQVRLDIGRVTGVEAIVGWIHPTWGRVNDADLRDALETSDVSRRLTLQVLRRVLSQVGPWLSADSTARVAVRTNAVALRDPDLAVELGELLDATGTAADQLMVEITEPTTTGSDAHLVRAARCLAERGIGLSVADFGSGHVSMERLRSLPVSEVKIHGSYVGRLLSSPLDRAIITSVHQLARALRIGVVAEGIEDEPTAAALAALPGMIGQGSYVGPPTTAAALAAIDPGRGPTPATEGRRAPR